MLTYLNKKKQFHNPYNVNICVYLSAAVSAAVSAAAGTRTCDKKAKTKFLVIKTFV